MCRKTTSPPTSSTTWRTGSSDQRQAGPGSDEAASDPTSGTTSSSSSMVSQSVDDNMVLEDLVKNLKGDNRYDGGVDISPKRGGDPVEEEVRSPSKALKQTALRKVPRLGDEVQPSSTASASGANRPQGDDVKVRMVVSGDLLEDGDGDLELPAQPPDRQRCKGLGDGSFGQRRGRRPDGRREAEHSIRYGLVLERQQMATPCTIGG